ncbi:unnamed protein product [Notodromas monacha]|uniref:Uncharacterized protein n=1 Tax=Notodromas monacha TaxID=399045 RepID=A0A7R9BZS8_9CRUS|nr:unnamed protein product [Notodromas monacha]CAG0923113.1 unnamed protein product [Notodromas monacha]
MSGVYAGLGVVFVLVFWPRVTGLLRDLFADVARRLCLLLDRLPETRPSWPDKSPDGETLLADQQVRVENANSQEEKLSDQIIPLKLSYGREKS